MKMKKFTALLLGLVSVFALTSFSACLGGGKDSSSSSSGSSSSGGGDGGGNTPVARQDAGALGYLFPEYEGFYYEEASVLEEENRVILSYTTNKTKNAEDSVIAVRTGVKTENGYSFEEEAKIAIEGSSNGWDKYNVGGSDLVAGNFKYGTTEYKYLMAYHANSISSRKRLQVGLAVSNDLTTWTKVGDAPFVAYDYEIYGDTDGVCNPSLVNVNGQGNVMLFYSYASSRITESRFVEAILSDLNAPVVSGSISVAHKGLPLDGLEWATVINADFAYNSENGEIYMVKDGMVFATQNAKKATLVQLARIPLADLYKQEAQWMQIASVMGLEAGGYTRMHSAALVSNEYARIGEDVSIVFTSSVAAQGINDTSYLFKSGLHYYKVVTGDNA